MSRLVVTNLMISNAGRRVSTQELAEIRRIAASCGASGTTASFTVTSDGRRKNWVAVVVVVARGVFVRSQGDSDVPVYELEKQGYDLCLKQVTK